MQTSGGLPVVECVTLPVQPESGTVYQLLPNQDEEAYYWERTDRNIGWITREEQELLRHSVIGVAGCGGMGGQLAEKFMRLGVGEIRIADNEVFDISNINRQFAATRKNVGRSKAFETARMLREITDDFKLTVYPQGICEETAEDFISGCDVVCDEIEFWAIGGRILLHRCGRDLGVPVFNCNTVGFGTRLFFFTPESGTMEEVLGFSAEEAEVLDQALRRKQASREMIQKAMQSVMRGLVPELPEYVEGGGNHAVIHQRLMQEGKASIIATNPPLATGFIADRILLYLLRNSETHRSIEPLPAMPAYLYFDAAKMEARVVKGQWW